MMPSSIIELTDSYTVPNYARYSVAFVRGDGRRLWDENGKSYLDMLSGLGVSCLGYGHADLIKAISDQAATLIHTSNLYYHEPGARLAQRICELTFADRVFFCNSGTEANEAAIKMARRFSANRHQIVACHDAFHGRTLGSLAATGQAALHEGFGPLPDGFVHVSYCDPAAIGNAIGPETAAVLLEPIMGEGGVIIPPSGYLADVRRICDDAGVLLILDEVQTGMGRTGKLFAHEHEDVEPDIATCAKGLAGGIPVGAVLAREKVAAKFVPGTHGSTFGANPVACRAAMTVLECLDSGGVIENCLRSGTHLLDRLAVLGDERDDIKEIRGRGLMIGIEFDRPTKPIVESCLANGLIVNATAGNVLRMLPPLTITVEEIDEGLDILRETLR